MLIAHFVEFEAYAKLRSFTTESLKTFAKQEGIDVGILVGRLLKEGDIKYSRYNELKTKYELTA